MSVVGTRNRTVRTAPEPRRGGRPRPQRVPVDGANALQIGLSGWQPNPEDIDGYEVAPTRSRRGARVTPIRSQPNTDPTQAPRQSVVPVAPPKPVALPRAAFLIAMVSLVVAGVIGVLLLNTKINENSFVLDELRARQAAQDLQEQQLAHELAERETPGNLAATARRLGLVPAGTPAYINLPDGRVVGVPQPASGGSGSATGGR